MRNCDNCEHDVESTDLYDEHRFIERYDVYLKCNIMEQNRHQFIYGYDNKLRRDFFQNLDKDFLIRTDVDSPMAIYLSEFGLPKVSIDTSSLDYNRIDILSREFLNFSIAHAMMVKSKDNVGTDILDSKIQEFLAFINRPSITNRDGFILSSTNDLINVLEESKEFYRTYYDDYLNGREVKDINSIKLPFLHLEFFVSRYKKALNNNSHFGIILDKSNDICLSSVKAVNTLVGSRINKDISMKVVVEPDKWDCYFDTNGQYINSIDDYEEVEFDESQKEYIRRLKNGV